MLGKQWRRRGRKAIVRQSISKTAFLFYLHLNHVILGGKSLYILNFHQALPHAPGLRRWEYLDPLEMFHQTAEFTAASCKWKPMFIYWLFMVSSFRVVSPPASQLRCHPHQWSAFICNLHLQHPLEIFLVSCLLLWFHDWLRVVPCQCVSSFRVTSFRALDRRGKSVYCADCGLYNLFEAVQLESARCFSATSMKWGSFLPQKSPFVLDNVPPKHHDFEIGLLLPYLPERGRSGFQALLPHFLPPEETWRDWTCGLFCAGHRSTAIS